MSVGKPHMAIVTATFNRPADTNTYTAADLVANDVDAGDVNPMEFAIGTGHGRGIKIVGARLQKSDASDVANSSFTLHLFASEPTITAGDQEPFAAGTDTANYIGSLTFPAMTAFSDDALAVLHSGSVSGGFNPLVTYLRSTSTIYGLLQAVGAYSGASAETFTVSLIIEQY